MKRFTLLALLASVSMVMFAQATDLVVDNQNPGWLSNVISFGDQKTVKNLKVTGYVNETDLMFIGTLMARELDGRLDLSEVEIISESGISKDNSLQENAFGLSGHTKDYINTIIFPKRLVSSNLPLGKGSSSIFAPYLQVDTLYFNWQNNYLKENTIGGQVSCLILCENLDSICANAAGHIQELTTCILSKSTKYIANSAFGGEKNLTYVNFNELTELEYLGAFAFRGNFSFEGSFLPDTLMIPTKITEFNSGAFGYRTGQHIFFHKDVSKITYAEESSRKYGIGTGGGLYLHMESMTPPSLYSTLGSSCIVYVPKGAKDIYMKDSHWSEATIIEENPLETILLDQHTASMEIGETLRLIPTFIPSDADDKTLTWSVKDESVAKVDDGVVTALAPGKTWVYATSVVEDVKDSCEVTVIQHVTDIAFDMPAVTLEGIGATAQLNVIITPEDATDKSVTWSSSNPSVCVVSNGKIVAVGYGTSVVIATSVDGGYMAVATVKVNEAGEVTLTIQQSANGAVSTQVEKGSVQTFAIQAESGWKIHSVTFNDADVTSDLDATNRYTTPTITENSTLYVTFEEDSATEVKATEASDIRVQSTSFGVRILNAANETANIYTPDGVLVKTVKVVGAQMDVELPEGGIYLVKVATKTVKVSR